MECSLGEYALSTHIVSGGDDRRVHVWRLIDTDDKLVQLEHVITKHTASVQYVRFIVTAAHAQIIVDACANDIWPGIPHQMSKEYRARQKIPYFSMSYRGAAKGKNQNLPGLPVR